MKETLLGKGFLRPLREMHSRLGVGLFLFFGEHVLAYTAKRADKILRQVFKFSSGRYSVIGIAKGLIVNPSARVANIFFHDFKIPFYKLTDFYF